MCVRVCCVIATAVLSVRLSIILVRCVKTAEWIELVTRTKAPGLTSWTFWLFSDWLYSTVFVLFTRT